MKSDIWQHTTQIRVEQKIKGIDKSLTDIRESMLAKIRISQHDEMLI